MMPTRHAPAVAAACGSSRSSSAARCQDSNRRPVRPRSGSTPHDDAHRSPESRACANWSVGRSSTTASRAHQTMANQSPRSLARNNGAFNQRSNPDANHQNRRPATAAPRGRSVHYRQIPIARHRCSCPISRGFLLWRLSDDGPDASRVPNKGPSSETLHNSGHASRIYAEAPPGSTGKEFLHCTTPVLPKSMVCKTFR
jgi:hypothetical protein